MASAYAALVSLSHIIHQILHPPPTHHFLIPRKQIESLQEQVGSLIDFLEKYSTQETEDLEKRIVGAAYEAEDIIESDVVNQIQAKYEIRRGINDSSFSLPKEIRKLLPIQKLLKKITILKVIKKMISIRKEADKIRNRRGVDDLGPANSLGASSSRSGVPGGKNVMIGFDEHLKEIRTVLATYESGLRITPVVGMGGIVLTESMTGSSTPMMSAKPLSLNETYKEKVTREIAMEVDYLSKLINTSQLIKNHLAALLVEMQIGSTSDLCHSADKIGGDAADADTTMNTVSDTQGEHAEKDDHDSRMEE